MTASIAVLVDTVELAMLVAEKTSASHLMV
jgi:hypothetical protein